MPLHFTRIHLQRPGTYSQQDLARFPFLRTLHAEFNLHPVTDISIDAATSPNPSDWFVSKASSPNALRFRFCVQPDYHLIPPHIPRRHPVIGSLLLLGISNPSPEHLLKLHLDHPLLSPFTWHLAYYSGFNHFSDSHILHITSHAGHTGTGTLAADAFQDLQQNILSTIHTRLHHPGRQTLPEWAKENSQPDANPL